MVRLIQFALLFVALSVPLSASAQTPVRLVAKLGDPVPADENAEIDEITHSRVGPNGEVSFTIRSSSNQRFPSQPLLDLRRATNVDSEDDQVLMPILGVDAVRDTMVDGFVANAEDVFAPEFQHDGHLLFDVRVVPPGEVGDAKGVAIRSPDGSYRIAFWDDARESLTVDAVQVDAMERILIRTPMAGHWFGGDSPTQLYDPMAPAPWDADELTGAYIATPLDDGRVALCCFEDAPVVWDNGTLTLTDPTPPTTDPVPQILTIAIHHTGRALYTDTGRDSMGNPYNAVFEGQIGEMATLVGPNFQPDLCGGFNIASNVHATSSGFFFTSPCIGAVFPPERLVGVGDELAGNGGTLTAIEFFDAHVSDDGSKVAFIGTATGISGDYRALFLIDDLRAGAQPVPVAVIGEEAAEMPGFLYSSIRPTAINNEGHVTFEADVQDPTSTASRALFVANQQPLDVVPEADLEALAGRLQVAGEQLLVEADVINHGPTFEFVTATVEVTGFETQLPIEDGDCSWEEGPTLTCTFTSADPEGLIPEDATATLRAALALPETPNELPESSSFEVSGELTDPDVSNNSAPLVVVGDSEPNATVDVDASLSDGEVEFVMTATNWGHSIRADLSYTLDVASGTLSATHPPACTEHSNPDFKVGGSCEWEFEQLTQESFVIHTDALNFAFNVRLLTYENLQQEDEELVVLDREEGQFEFGVNPENPRSDDVDRGSGCAIVSSPFVSPLALLFVALARLGRRRRKLKVAETGDGS